MTATAELEAPVQPAIAPNQKLVALTLFGIYPKGKVFRAGDFPNCDRYGELLADKKLRFARPEEENLDIVALADEPQRHQSYESRLLEKDNTIHALRMDIARLGQELGHQRQLATAPKQIPQAVSNRLIQEKDRLIEELQASLQGARAEAVRLQREIGDPQVDADKDRLIAELTSQVDALKQAQGNRQGQGQKR